MGAAGSRIDFVKAKLGGYSGHDIRGITSLSERQVESMAWFIDVAGGLWRCRCRPCIRNRRYLPQTIRIPPNHLLQYLKTYTSMSINREPKSNRHSLPIIVALDSLLDACEISWYWRKSIVGCELIGYESRYVATATKLALYHYSHLLD